MVNSSADMAMEDWPARDAVRVIAAGGAKAVSAHEAVTSMCPRGCVWGGLRRCNGILLTAESKGGGLFVQISAEIRCLWSKGNYQTSPCVEAALSCRSESTVGGVLQRPTI